MIKHGIIILGLFVLLSQSACTNFESNIIQDVKSNQDLYSELIKTVGKCNFPAQEYGKFISSSEFPDCLKDVLSRTTLNNKVNYLVIDKIEGCKSFGLEFISGNIHLVFDSCPDSGFPKAGSYNKEGFIEYWGINSNWYIWKDNDFI